MAFSWLQRRDDELIHEIPTLWLLGKPDSGKKSIVEALTSYDKKPSIKGFTLCGKRTKSFEFPSDASPILRIMVTNGIEKSVQDVIEDISICHKQSHIIVISARIMDLDQTHIYEAADFLRKISPRPPILLALTCLHEAYDGCNHPDPYPFTGPPPWRAHDPKLQQLNYAGLQHWSLMRHPASRTVLVDITPNAFGYTPEFYGIDALFENIIDLLPRHARKLIIAWMNGEQIAINYVIHRYSCLAEIAGKIPFPGDVSPEVILVQESMISTLSRLLKFQLHNSELLFSSQYLMESTAKMWPPSRLFDILLKFLSLKPSKQYPSFYCVSTAALGLLYIWHTKNVLMGHHPSLERICLEYRKKIRIVLNKWPHDFQSSSA